MRPARRAVALGAAVVVLAALAAAVALGVARDGGGDGGEDGDEAAPSWDVSAYHGLGAWVDVFDYAPAYQPEGESPPISPEDVAVMAAGRVRTLYLQAARR